MKSCNFVIGNQAIYGHETIVAESGEFLFRQLVRHLAFPGARIAVPPTLAMGCDSAYRHRAVKFSKKCVRPQRRSRGAGGYERRVGGAMSSGSSRESSADNAVGCVDAGHRCAAGIVHLAARDGRRSPATSTAATQRSFSYG